MNTFQSNLYGEWQIGDGTTIGAFCEIGGKIGKFCKIQAGVKIPPLTIIGDNVFIGANVVFTNDKYMDGNMEGVVVEDNVKIGAGSLILAGVKIGKCSILGMGSVV
ncbi:MAG: DapH/DapD/GlmU-related protein, partial [Nanoarchaeota archaeon]